MSKQHRPPEVNKVSKSDEVSLQQTSGATAASKEDDSSPGIECSVCLQPCVHPVALPCEHVFCFLCVKGFMARSRSCALCRFVLPLDYCDKPQILDREQLLASSLRPVSSDGHHWFYMGGSGGWWQYEDRIADDLEEAFTKKESKTKISVSGFQYVVDFNEMVQYQLHDPSRRRRIKRDVVTISKKGVAGIPLVDQPAGASGDKEDLAEGEDEPPSGERDEGSSTTDEEGEGETEGRDGIRHRRREEDAAASPTDADPVNELAQSVEGLSLDKS